MKPWCLLLGLLIAFTGCIGPSNTTSSFQASPPPPVFPPFDEAEYAPYGKAGTAVITGQAFARTRGGEVRHAAGSDVILSPATAHGVGWSKRTLYMEKFAIPDSRALLYMRTTTADASGNFSFEKLPAGNYVIVTSVFWEVPDVYGTYVHMSKTGGFLIGTVSVQDGEKATVIVK